MQCSECQSGEKFKQTRVNGGSIYDSLKVTSSECQSNGNLKQVWVNGGRGRDSLKIASALNFQRDASDLWLRDDLEGVYALLFQFLGFGFRLAMSNVGWHVTQKFVVLVPDPIGFAPWPVLLDPGEPSDICQHTSSRPLFVVLFVTPRNKDDMGDGVPTDQLSHNHCDCTDSHCNSLIVLRVCLCFFLSHLLSQVHWRQKQLSDFVETKKYWTLKKSCGSQSSEWDERKKSRAKRGSLCTRGGSRKTVTCHGLRVVEPVYHQA